MDQNETTPIENIENNPQNVTPVEHKKSRAEEIELRKKSFFKKVKIVLTIVFSLIALSIISLLAIRIYNNNKKLYVSEQVPDESVTIVKKEETEEVVNAFYKNEKYGFSIEHLKKDMKIIEDEDGKEFSLSIVSSETMPADKTSGFDIIKGYILTINPLRLSGRSVDEVARVKKEWFIEQCPKTAIFSEIETANVASHEGKYFEISQCNSDFIVSYIPANNYIYELVQTYKGDVGFVQKYRLETDFIVKSFTLYEDLPEPDPTIVYKSSRSSFMFEYPRELDIECCKVPEPPKREGSYLWHIVTVSEGDNDKSIGFYSAPLVSDTDYETYANRFENLLRDDYKVIKGMDPQGSREPITVGDDIKAYYYRDLSWKGNNYIMFARDDQREAILASVTNINQEYLEQILKSITFYR